MWPSTPLANKWAPICKKPCHLAIPIIKDWRIADFLKKDIFRPLFRARRDAFRGLRCWPACYSAVPAAPGRLNAAWVLTKPLLLKNWPIYGIYGHIHRCSSHIHTCSRGRLQGHLWIMPTIGSCFYGPLWLFSVFVSGLLPHTWSKIPKNTTF